jgi:glycerophosphoryl diester phosphodiesterase
MAAVPAPLVIGHRGASGYVPEHTLASYFIAIQQGADYIEPDLVSTRDGVLIARHENEIGGTTDVARHAQFAARKTQKVIDGTSITGWFTEDFTLAELKTLRARERIPQLRPGNARFDGQFEVPTFDEILALVRALEEQRAAAALARGASPPARIGVYPETKHPSYFAGLGLALEAPLLTTLLRYGYEEPTAPIFIQSFEVANLRELRTLTRLPLVQLVNATGVPHDCALRGEPHSYRDLITPAGLAVVAQYADVVGVDKALVIERGADARLGAATTLVADAHAAGLAVHAWTFRAEGQFLPPQFRSGPDPAALGNIAGEVTAYLTAGIDGFFIDQPDWGVRARTAFLAHR